jgi:hypothetical protein
VANPSWEDTDVLNSAPNAAKEPKSEGNRSRGGVSVDWGSSSSLSFIFALIDALRTIVQCLRLCGDGEVEVSRVVNVGKGHVVGTLTGPGKEGCVALFA